MPLSEPLAPRIRLAPEPSSNWEGTVARERNQPDERAPRSSGSTSPSEREANRAPGDEIGGQRDAAEGPRGFFVRATERRVYIQPRQEGHGDAHRSSGDSQRGESGRGSEYAGDRETREARARDAGPYSESRAPRHRGLPVDMRAGEGQWAQPSGHGEVGERPRSGGYEPQYEQGQWSPGGDASVPLGMGYGDFGVRRESGKRRWKREPVLAREIMTSNPEAVRPESSLRDVARIMRDENTGIVPVCSSEGKLLGVVTDRDIVMRTLADNDSPADATARDVMTADVEAVTPDEELRGVVQLMGEHQIRRVPVVERGDRLVGIISMADVATRADFDEDLQDALEEISARRSFWSKMFR